LMEGEMPSRIGKKPVPVPKGVKVEVSDERVQVSSADGKRVLQRAVANVTVKVDGGQVVVAPKDESRAALACHGLYRTLIANMVEGVAKGYQKTLLVEGAGYKAELKGRTLVLTVGYTLPREFPVPAGIEVECPNANQVVIKGYDKELVGQTAATLRRIRPPDPYRGKGIRYDWEKAVRKAPKGKGK